ncbi:Gfo/Idh/MocA family oxidoreductase [Alphaproteobacteria bacterium]|nr:Gfo/Idh/MocA family oxidoreductase [Alphaproteobacteria bacterium]
MLEKCLVIGLGKIGMGYDLNLDPTVAIFSHARAISLHPYFELVGAVDSSNLQRSIFEKHYNCPAFDDISAAIMALRPTVVIIASPTETHANILNQVLSQEKPKVIMCEKPLAYDLVEARQMVDACDEEGVNLFVNYPRRSDPGIIEVKRRINKNKICLPIKGIAWYSKGFLHNGSHYFNLLEFWLGKFIGFKLIDSGRLCDGIDSQPNVEIYYDDGSVVFISAWKEPFSHSSLELLSQSGRLSYERNGTSIEWQSVVPDPSFAGDNILDPSIEIIDDGSKQYQWHVLNQLAEIFKGNYNSLCTGHQALITLQSMHEIIRER